MKPIKNIYIRKEVNFNRIYLLLFLFFFAGIIFPQTPQAITISPGFNEIANNVNPEISAIFNVSMDSSSFNELSFAVFGERSGYHTGQINYIDGTKTVSFNSTKQFNAGERVTVTLSDKIRSQQGDTLQGFIWTFRIPSSPAPVNFSEPVTYNGGGFFMQCIDINNDGYPDIITSSGVILINNGNGVFNNSWNINDVNPYDPIICEDFNRDGYMDVLYSGSGGIKIGLGDGNGNFSFTTYPNWFYNFISADFNGDGYPDIAGVTSSTSIPPDSTILNFSVTFNDGSGNFNDTVMYHIEGGGNPSFMIATDLDNDGNEDIVIASLPITPPLGGAGINGFIVAKNNGKGIFNNFQLYPNTIYSVNISFPYYLYSSDFNNDHYNDIALISSGSGIVDLNLGDGILGNDTTDLRGFWPAENAAPITGGDINGDGWIDLIVSGYMWPPEQQIPHYAVTINEDSYFPGSSPWEDFNDTLPSGITESATADLNNDGRLDIVHCSNVGVFITLNQDTITSVKGNKESVKDFNLSQNYPNPFNNQTNINFNIPQSGNVKITIYNILGEEVRLLENRFYQKGEHTIKWDGKDNQGIDLSSGVYIIRVNSLEQSKQIKSIMLK